MSDYPNMSYCMCENTSLAVNQILAAMQESGSTMQFFHSLSQREQAALIPLLSAMREIVEAAEQEDELFF